MDYQTEDLILHYVTEDDLAEVARTWPADHHPLSDTETWPADHHPLSDAEAREAIAYMRGNYERNMKGSLCHLASQCAGRSIPERSWDGADWTARGTIRNLKSSSCWMKHTEIRDTEPNV